jgi:hypothetical protein
MRFMVSLVLLMGTAVVSQGSPTKPPPAKPAVPVVKDAILLLVFESGTSGRPKVLYETPAPVTSLEEGLPYAQKASKLPVLAMSESESKEWFFYATSVGPDGHGRPAGVFTSGYAIKRGGCQVIPCLSAW